MSKETLKDFPSFYCKLLKMNHNCANKNAASLHQENIVFEEIQRSTMRLFTQCGLKMEKIVQQKLSRYMRKWLHDDD